jgi:creatinine amidohydrolase
MRTENGDMNRLLFEEHTREALRELAPRVLAVMPTGATEQHGPHLPVGTDTLTVEFLARQAAREASRQIPVLVTPTVPFGSSHHHLPFGGTLSLSTDTYYRAMLELVESLILGGFRRVFIVNGHGGNHELLQLVVRDVALRHQAQLAATSYWIGAWDELVKSGAHAGGRIPGHAGALETSQVLALRPELVGRPPHRDSVNEPDPPIAIRPYRLEVYGAWRAIEGFTDSPDRATPERGRMALEVAASALARAFVEFYGKTGSV